MNIKGKSYLRTAKKRLKLEWKVIAGVGIEILSPQNAIQIIAHKATQVDNATKRAEKTTNNVRSRVYEQLHPTEQNVINVFAALYGSIRAFSNSAKRLFTKQIPKVGEISNEQNV